jgi:integrase
MAKITERLTDLKCKNAKPTIRPDGTMAKTTLLPDGSGLYLQLSTSTKAPERAPDETATAYRQRLIAMLQSGDVIQVSKSWVFRSAVGGKEHRIGLGPYPKVSLTEARERADGHRAASRNGTNPLDAKRQKERDEERAAREKKAADALAAARGTTFKEAAERYMAGQKAGWSSAVYRGQWSQSLEDYAYPVFGDLPVSDVTPELVLQVLHGPDYDPEKPETSRWVQKTKTMKDLRARIAKVINFAAVKGLRPKGPNPAAWKDNLEVDLAKPSKVTPVVNHPALPYTRAPAFMARLRDDHSVAARALEFTILCASRAGEVFGARWGEFDLKARLWTIPANRMKGRETHNTPLSDRACAILTAIKCDTIPHPSALVFTNRVGLQLADTMLLRLARRLQPDMPELTVHGFRSTFRDWVSEETNHAPEVAEHALAHKVKGVEGDYRRGTALKKRRALMEDWARYCAAAPAEMNQVA